MSEPAPAVKIGLVTVSDRASAGVYEDLGGPAMRAVLEEFLRTPFAPLHRVIPDERPAIEAALRALVDDERCPLVLTTGGTGPARRDVTVEATLAVAHKRMPGFGELMRKVSLEKVPTAILSAQEAESVLAVPNVHTPVGLRNRAILEVLYSTGIRRTELTRLDR